VLPVSAATAHNLWKEDDSRINKHNLEKMIIAELTRALPLEQMKI